jgi:hypothetical protein
METPNKFEIGSMETKVIQINPFDIHDELFKLPVELILAGNPVGKTSYFTLFISLLLFCLLSAFPTETVYGLGANALDPGAVKKV